MQMVKTFLEGPQNKCSVYVEREGFPLLNTKQKCTLYTAGGWSRFAPAFKAKNCLLFIHPYLAYT